MLTFALALKFKVHVHVLDTSFLTNLMSLSLSLFCGVLIGASDCGLMPPKKKRSQKKTAGSPSKSATESDVVGADNSEGHGAEANHGAVTEGTEADHGSGEEVGNNNLRLSI